MKIFDLKGKVAIVTGGNGGIGLGMAKGLAEAGAKIAIAAQNEAKGKKAIAEIEQLGSEAAFFPVDIGKEEDCRKMIAAVAAKFGRIDILDNCSGIAIRKRPETYTDAEWHQVMNINLTGTFACCQAVYPEMKKAGGGKIINIGSLMSVFGGPMSLPYAASKGAVDTLTVGLAKEVAGDGIRVNAVRPGLIRTDIHADCGEPGRVDRLSASIPLQRGGTPEEVAAAVLWLCSDEASYTTGTFIDVSGGR